MWEYSLTAQEEAVCTVVGFERQKPYLGDPSKNVNYSEGDLWELWQHAVCAGSELAFARMLGNQEFTPHFNKWKTELDIPGVGEVRYSFNENPYLRYTTRDNPDLKYVLMVGGMAIKNRTNKNQERRSHPYKAIGWAYGRDCMNSWWLPPYSDTYWQVPLDSLRPMSQFSETPQPTLF